MLLLTAGAASTDAASYLGLGQVFPANMTGNTVLLAVGTATAKFDDALRSSLALSGFVLGALVTATAAGTDERGRWSRTGRRGLLMVLAMQLAGTIWWQVADPPATGAATLGIIGLFGLAMGAQSATMARIGMPVSTTYITGTWTQVSMWVGRLLGRTPAGTGSTTDRGDRLLQAAVLGLYFAVALGAGYLFRFIGRPVAFVPCAATLAALVTATARSGARRCRAE